VENDPDCSGFRQQGSALPYSLGDILGKITCRYFRSRIAFRMGLLGSAFGGTAGRSGQTQDFRFRFIQQINSFGYVI
jgi:hypothetical protein